MQVAKLVSKVSMLQGEQDKTEPKNKEYSHREIGSLLYLLYKNET